jgi:hypothetical protein
MPFAGPVAGVTGELHSLYRPWKNADENYLNSTRPFPPLPLRPESPARGIFLFPLPPLPLHVDSNSRQWQTSTCLFSSPRRKQLIH